MSVNQEWEYLIYNISNSTKTTSGIIAKGQINVDYISRNVSTFSVQPDELTPKYMGKDILLLKVERDNKPIFFGWVREITQKAGSRLIDFKASSLFSLFDRGGNFGNNTIFDEDYIRDTLSANFSGQWDSELVANINLVPNSTSLISVPIEAGVELSSMNSLILGELYKKDIVLNYTFSQGELNFQFHTNNTPLTLIDDYIEEIDVVNSSTNNRAINQVIAGNASETWRFDLLTNGTIVEVPLASTNTTNRVLPVIRKIKKVEDHTKAQEYANRELSRSLDPILIELRLKDTIPLEAELVEDLDLANRIGQKVNIRVGNKTYHSMITAYSLQMGGKSTKIKLGAVRTDLISILNGSGR